MKNFRINIMCTEDRPDRQKYIQKHLLHYPEFQFSLYIGERTELGWDGLFENMKKAVENCKYHPYCIIGEDDLELTPYYSHVNLIALLESAMALDADVLIGGCSFCSDVRETNKSSLLEVTNFYGTQFIVLFPKFYDRFINVRIDEPPEIFIGQARDVKRILTYPFISYQCNMPSDFGREDVRQQFVKNEQNIEVMIGLKRSGNGGRYNYK